MTGGMSGGDAVHDDTTVYGDGSRLRMIMQASEDLLKETDSRIGGGGRMVQLGGGSGNGVGGSGEDGGAGLIESSAGSSAQPPQFSAKFRSSEFALNHAPATGAASAAGPGGAGVGIGASISSIRQRMEEGLYDDHRFDEGPSGAGLDCFSASPGYDSTTGGRSSSGSDLATPRW